MTIKIFNNSGYNIYPVLSTGTSIPEDPFLQAALQVPSDPAVRKANPYPKLNQFRLYINPTGDGIPPGGSITLELPFYTQLVATDKVDPTLSDQYINWWGGGRIEIFDAPGADHKPPAALTADYLGTNPARAKQVEVKPLAGATIANPKLTVCNPAPCQPLKIFKDPAGLGNNEPSQLTEYTLSALDFNVQPSQPYGLNYNNVDYDVSYVDAAYLPVAMSYNNDQVGYIGSTLLINTFRNAVLKFLGAKIGAGWPLFIDDQKVKILKIPSPINIFGGLTQPNPRTDLTKQPWPPFDAMKANWDLCTVKAGTAPICPYMRDVRKLLQANFNNCRGVSPNQPNEAFMLSHVYGWSPFNTECASSISHELADTPGYYEDIKQPDGTIRRNYKKYQEVKDKFDKLQYWPGYPSEPNGEFDPFLVLIHGKDYVNAPNTYAYSVDDALGNMQVEGDGLILAVGGPGGLPNKDPATPPINVSLGYSSKDLAKFTKYGVCKKTPNKDVIPTFPGFAISAVHPEKCPVSLLDNYGKTYFFKVSSQPPYPALPPPPAGPQPGNFAPINCGDNPRGSPEEGWCKTIVNNKVEYGVFVHTVKGLGGSKTDTHYAITRPALAPR
jgi:hypothetical protein